METAWQGGFPIQPAAFGQAFNGGQIHEDWEDWLRWDPTLEPTSPEDDTIISGSSKNDSPIQNTMLPAEGALFGKNETLAPPMVLGEDAFDFGNQQFGGDDMILFGASREPMADYDFQPLIPSEQQLLSVPKIDTNMGAWSFNSHIEPQSIDIAALSNDNRLSLPSTGTVSSNAGSVHYSPESTTRDRTSISSTSPDPPKKRGGRKRKAEVEEELKELNGDSQEDGDEPPEKKTSHNVIEKRYRNNLNDKIVELRSAVPSLRAIGKANKGDDSEDLEGLTAAHKLNKATIMAKATEYIKHLEKRNKTMADEMASLKTQLAAVETSFGKSRDKQASVSNAASSTTPRPRHTSSASQNGLHAFMNTQDPTRFNQPTVQQQYAPHQQTPNYARQPGPPVEAQNQPQYVNGRGGRGLVNKVMLGTMAGIMVMEGFSESESGNGGSTNALFAPPMQLLKRTLWVSSPSSSSGLQTQAFIPLLKVFVVVGVLLYLLTPLLSFSPRRKQRARPAVVRLPHPPSLASPIEVRRKAWLTAIQTVWVPKHFLLEVAAVTSKMISLSLRQLIGSEAFNSLTGANKDDEIARIKAWDIAIDAQLAGGDQQVSYYRLLLTLMESGTLPDSPTRLMQKAVHFRVFFWEVANAGYGNLSGFKQFTEKVGRYYWDQARRQHNELVQAKSPDRQALQAEGGVEMLPDHLATLIELPCDKVLSDEMIQRAWSLAWNKPSAYRTLANSARDAVVEDHAIRSPLDAVAAWYANMTVDETLEESFNDKASTLDIEYWIGLAVLVAPPASATLARTLAAKAILSNTNREANILTALEALPIGSHRSSEMNIVNHIPATPDVRIALTFAKLLALSSPKAPIAANNRALDAVAALHLPPACFTLLTASAAFQLLKQLSTDYHCPVDTRHGLEDLAANLRVWIGTSAGRSAGIGHEGCAQIVNLCLEVTMKVGGWDDRDSGYGSTDSRSAEGSPVMERAAMDV